MAASNPITPINASIKRFSSLRRLAITLFGFFKYKSRKPKSHKLSIPAGSAEEQIIIKKFNSMEIINTRNTRKIYSEQLMLHKYLPTNALSGNRRLRFGMKIVAKLN